MQLHHGYNPLVFNNLAIAGFLALYCCIYGELQVDNCTYPDTLLKQIRPKSQSLHVFIVGLHSNVREPMAATSPLIYFFEPSMSSVSTGLENSLSPGREYIATSIGFKSRDCSAASAYMPSWTLCLCVSFSARLMDLMFIG